MMHDKKPAAEEGPREKQGQGTPEVSAEPFLPWTLDRLHRSGLRRVGDLPGDGWHRAPCRHSMHSPPTMIVLPDGMYEHVCPGCGHTTQFTIRHPRLQHMTMVVCDLGTNLGFSLGQVLGC